MRGLRLRGLRLRGLCLSKRLARSPEGAGSGIPSPERHPPGSPQSITPRELTAGAASTQARGGRSAAPPPDGLARVGAERTRQFSRPVARPALPVTVSPSRAPAASPVQFLGNDVAVDYDRARVAVLPVPFEATTTYRKGCGNGPDAFLDASQQVEFYDDELEREWWPVGLWTHAPVADRRSRPDLSPEDMVAEVRAATGRLVADGKFAIAVGGEHSITAGVVAAYRDALGDEPFAVVQIDAHGDLRQEYEGSIYNHACVMRRVVEMGLPTLQVGIRSLCTEEADLIARSPQIQVVWARDIALQHNWVERAIGAIPTRKVFLTIDLDGIDPSLMPGVGTPEPGGLNWYALLHFLRRLFAAHDVVGCDVMELAPVGDSVVSEFVAAKLAYKLVGYQAATRGW